MFNEFYCIISLMFVLMQAFIFKCCIYSLVGGAWWFTLVMSVCLCVCVQLVV